MRLFVLPEQVFLALSLVFLPRVYTDSAISQTQAQTLPLMQNGSVIGYFFFFFRVYSTLLPAHHLRKLHNSQNEKTISYYTSTPKK